MFPGEKTKVQIVYLFKKSFPDSFDQQSPGPDQRALCQVPEQVGQQYSRDQDAGYEIKRIGRMQGFEPVYLIIKKILYKMPEKKKKAGNVVLFPDGEFSNNTFSNGMINAYWKTVKKTASKVKIKKGSRNHRKGRA
jgi:hypothetical protein